MLKYDKWLLLIVVLLVGFGALMIYSSTSVVTSALAKRGVTEFYYFKRHVFTILIGFTFMFVSYKLNLSFIKKISVPLLIVAFLLLVLVFVPHVGVSAG